MRIYANMRRLSSHSRKPAPIRPKSPYPIYWRPFQYGLALALTGADGAS